MNNIEIMSAGTEKLEIMHKFGNRDYCTSMHIHSNFEIYLSLCDDNKFCVGNKIYDVNRNDVFLFNNTDIHKINISDPETYERYVVMFPPSILAHSDPDVAKLLDCFDSKLSGHTHRLPLTDAQKTTLYDLFEKMARLKSDETAKNYAVKLRLCLLEILIFLNDIRTPATSCAALPEHADPRLELVMEYIRMHCAYTITLDELSLKFYLNKFYLCRMFKQKLGFSISEYIESCRLSNALVLLRDGLPVSTVALKTGFGSDTYFISTFKKHLGTSPKKYVKEV